MTVLLLLYLGSPSQLVVIITGLLPLLIILVMRAMCLFEAIFMPDAAQTRWMCDSVRVHAYSLLRCCRSGFNGHRFTSCPDLVPYHRATVCYTAASELPSSVLPPCCATLYNIHLTSEL
eukprot:scpid64421/ scgid34578/ 